MTTDRETEIADLIAGHREKPNIARGVEECRCGESAVGQPGWYRAHQAAVLAAYITDREAEAWDAGHLKGMHHSHPGICDDEICPNPFRFTPDTEGHDSATNKIPN